MTLEGWTNSRNQDISVSRSHRRFQLYFYNPITQNTSILSFINLLRKTSKPPTKMRGKVTIEEAFEIPSEADQSRDQAAIYVAPDDLERYLRQIKSITGERLKISEDNGIGYTVLSLTVPGIQGIREREKAESHAREVNNYIADKIKDHRDRLGAFAALSMHDPAQAGKELRRCVKELGFHGALLNDVQHTNQRGRCLYYDQPEYDEFWRVAVELDVPIYLHPAAPTGDNYKEHYENRKYLVGPPQSFCNAVGRHVMGLITNGVFDRFPNLKLILGHLGERIPFDFWRANHWINDVERPLAKKNGDTMCERDVLHYFKNNIYVTTSGHFSTNTLRFVAEEIGVDRIMFSVDYPYERLENGCGWFDNNSDELKKILGGRDGYLRVGRDNAKNVLKLSKFKDSDAPV